jgi:Zn-dependent protease with chaperone function
MIKTNINKIILFIYIAILFGIMLSLGISLKISLFIICFSFLVLKTKFQNSMQKNWTHFFKEDEINWINNSDSQIQDFLQLAKKNGLHNIRFGCFKNDDINAYAFEDLSENHVVLFSEYMKANYSKLELEAVILHELGHLKHKHISSRLLISNASQVFLLTLLVAILVNTSMQSNIIIGTLVALVISWPVINSGKFLALIIDQAFSRKCEYEADTVAIRYQGTPIHIMKVLSNLEHDPAETNIWKRFINKIKYNEPDWLKTHPNTDKRLANAEKFIFVLKK